MQTFTTQFHKVKFMFIERDTYIYVDGLVRIRVFDIVGRCMRHVCVTVRRECLIHRTPPSCWYTALTFALGGSCRFTATSLRGDRLPCLACTFGSRLPFLASTSVVARLDLEAWPVVLLVPLGLLLRLGLGALSVPLALEIVPRLLVLPLDVLLGGA